jgi:molybdopterin-guanine dinucleotide biosynthesis protein A
MFDVEGFILVGGASRRMGRDKALLDFGGQPLVERIAHELSTLASAVSLVGAREAHASFKNVPDIYQQWGALGGIHAALTAAKTDWAAVVACDLPFVTGKLFERLTTFVNNTTDAVVPIQADGRPQPVCALYRVAKCLPEIEKVVAAGEHTPQALLAKVRTRFIDFAELSDLPAADHFFFNVNRPEDLKKAQDILSSE